MWYLALRNLWQRRLRALLTVLGVAVAVQLFLTMSGIMTSYEVDLQRQLSTLAGKVFVQRPTAEEGVLDDFPAPSSSIEAGVALQLLEIDGVDRAASSAILYVPLSRSPAPNLPPTTLAVGIELGHEGAFLGDLEVDAGQLSLDGPDSVVLGQRAAEQYAPEGSDGPAEPGDTIEVLGRSFTVVGVLESAPNLFTGMVMMELSSAQELFNRQGNVSAVILAATSVDDVPAIRAAVSASFPELEAASQDDIAAGAREMLAGMNIFFGMINSTVIVVAIVVVTIVMTVSVLEQRRNIGILRAIGARRGAIFSMVAGEALVLSLLGAICAWPLWALFSGMFIGDLLVSAEGLVSGWIQMLMLALVVGLFSSLLPAWRAVRVDPLEALRYE
ncbi:MAG: ABC transporter permease [Anaerolineales bacterium]|nr:MAG: ABC transporter permease [Anaerolineales bacterium]